MPTQEYNQWDWGIAQDDILVPPATYLEWKNVDGLRTGYGITLWPKVEEQIVTISIPTAIIDWGQTQDNANLVWDYVGNVYRFSNADSTADFTSAKWYSIVWGLQFNGFYLIFTKDSAGSDMEVIKVEDTYVNDWTWTWAVETWDDWSWPSWKVPFILFWDLLIYSLSSAAIRVVDSSFTQTSFWFIDSYAVWYSLQGTTIKVYCKSGNVYYWWADSSTTTWLAATYTSSQNYWFEIENMISIWATDYLTSEAWDFYAVSGQSTPTRITKMQMSLRLQDNSSYQNKLDFEENTTYFSKTLQTHRQDIYASAPNDSVPGIYKYGKLFPWLWQGFNKIITEDPSWNAFTQLTDITYHKDNKKLYFWYVANAVNAVWYIDTTVLTTAKDWYLVTPVLRWPPNKINKMKEVRLTTSYTNGSNYIKLYKRIDNWSWTLFRTINESTNVITRTRITTDTSEFVDIQFKVEIHNDTQANTPPILHWLELDYSINKD